MNLMKHQNKAGKTELLYSASSPYISLTPVNPDEVVQVPISQEEFDQEKSKAIKAQVVHKPRDLAREIDEIKTRLGEVEKSKQK